MTDPRRDLPSVDAVLRTAGAVAPAERERLVDAVRVILAAARAKGASGDPTSVLAQARQRLAARDVPTLRHVINATGVVLHTNLGRASLSAQAIDAIRDAASGVSVEYDLEAGKRGERHGHAARLLADLSGAEDGLVTNNGAAAVLLALAAIAGRREVIVARGELIEIGGGFRIPDVLVRSGAKLVEVGTTNRTYARDYAAAITDRTAALLRVHASNFRVVGFTASAESSDLAQLARERGVAFIHDLGSGTLLDTERFGLGREQTVQEAVAAGADLVTFSGDKLLGGPQAGIAVGRAEIVAKLRSHPLMRALRPDKLTIAALVATLVSYRDGTAEEDLPVWRMIGADAEGLQRRATALARRLHGEVVPTRSTVGGGSLPEETQPSFAVALPGRPHDLAQQARRADPPVIGRVVAERFALDLRSVLPEDDERLADALGVVAKRVEE